MRVLILGVKETWATGLPGRIKAGGQGTSHATGDDKISTPDRTHARTRHETAEQRTERPRCDRSSAYRRERAPDVGITCLQGFGGCVEKRIL